MLVQISFLVGVGTLLFDSVPPPPPETPLPADHRILPQHHRCQSGSGPASKIPPAFTNACSSSISFFRLPEAGCGTRCDKYLA